MIALIAMIEWWVNRRKARRRAADKQGARP